MVKTLSFLLCCPLRLQPTANINSHMAQITRIDLILQKLISLKQLSWGRSNLSNANSLAESNQAGVR